LKRKERKERKEGGVARNRVTKQHFYPEEKQNKTTTKTV